MAVKQRPPGWWYPWIFVGGMAVVVVVNVVMMTLAVKTFPGLETKDAYQKGLEHNKILAKARQQAERGWKVDLDFPAEAGKPVDLVVTFRDKQDQPLEGLTVEADFIRPTVAGYDFRVVLAPRGEGVYAASATVPLVGQWSLNLLARRGEETYEDSRKIRVP
jgi:nitrogen fixation protein FixH